MKGSMTTKQKFDPGQNSLVQGPLPLLWDCTLSVRGVLGPEMGGGRMQLDSSENAMQKCNFKLKQKMQKNAKKCKKNMQVAFFPLPCLAHQCKKKP